MRIGVIADTHILNPRERLPDAVFREFRGVDLILHCGDIYDLSCLDHLQTLTLPDDEPLPEVLQRKFGQVVDIVAFGDSHEELIETHGGVLFINPGSPTYPGVRHPMGELGTLAILEIASGQARAEILKLRP